MPPAWLRRGTGRRRSRGRRLGTRGQRAGRRRSRGRRLGTRGRGRRSRGRNRRGLAGTTRSPGRPRAAGTGRGRRHLGGSILFGRGHAHDPVGGAVGLVLGRVVGRAHRGPALHLLMAQRGRGCARRGRRGRRRRPGLVGRGVRAGADVVVGLRLVVGVVDRGHGWRVSPGWGGSRAAPGTTPPGRSSPAAPARRSRPASSAPSRPGWCPGPPSSAGPSRRR